ncbi:hypothetical protein T02_14495 [Trichinella nativa]|uniref:Uncharacterized protein n=1 Tax=Trichinella nativa TaxID=6335 RepID=A0A0V1LAC8_9BILA|nr:hypothetical protein T02_14495 [Trichinella nativa]
MLLATAFLPVPQVDTGVSLLEAGTTGRIKTWIEGWHNRLNRKAGNATVGDLRRINKFYAEKQQRVAQHTGEYTNRRRTLERFQEALIYIKPEPI